MGMTYQKTSQPPALEGYQGILGNSFAGFYGTGIDVWSDEQAMRSVLPLLLDRLRPDSLVLDVGAGRGRDTLGLLQAGHRVEALDLVRTPDWVALTHRWPRRLTYRQGGLLQVDLGACYDGVMDNGCLHHQHPDLYGPYLRKLWEHTGPGAVLVVSFFTPIDEAGPGTLWVQPDGRLNREFSLAEAVALLRKHGWAVEQTTVIPRQSAERNYLVLVARHPGHPDVA